MKQIRRGVTLLLCLCMALSLCACGGKQDAAGDTETDTPPKEETVTPPSGAPLPLSHYIRSSETQIPYKDGELDKDARPDIYLIQDGAITTADPKLTFRELARMSDKEIIQRILTVVENLQNGPCLVGITGGVSAQPEDPPAPAVTPPPASPASFVQTDSAPAEDQDLEPPAESQDPEPPEETQDPELPVENQGPEAPAQPPKSPTQNAGEPVQQSEDSTQAAQEMPTAVEETRSLEEKLDEQVQKVLDNIITDGMTKLEQAKAVWNFTKNGISYTGSSDKSDWISGAYAGLTTRRGDCFTYYAVSRALLTALGIDNLEVRRVGGISSHYWNLVNCGDGWYHFDATPRSSKLPYFVSFMFTDEEAADYTARVGGRREYYTFDGSLYPARGTGDPTAESSG